AEGGTVGRGGERELRRHAIDQDGDRERRGEPQERGPVRPHVEESEEPEEDGDRNGGHQRRRDKTAVDGRVHLRPGHLCCSPRASSLAEKAFGRRGVYDPPDGYAEETLTPLRCLAHWE